MRPTLPSLLTLSACLLSAGCGDGDAPAEPVYPVTGTVTYGGQPVEGATVTFKPDNPGARPAFGFTNAEGVYKLTTFAPGDGAMPGGYKIGVEKGSGADEEVNEQSPEEYYDSENYDPNAISRPDPAGTREPPIPVAYATPASSGLFATVTEGGENVVDLPLD